MEAKDIETELRALAGAVRAARAAEDLFGDLGPNEGERTRALALVFRRLARVLHPDRHATEEAKTIAHDAFVRASELRGVADAKIRAGTYGDRSAPAEVGMVRTAKRTYVVGGVFARGDLADLHHATSDGARFVFKIARSPADADLLDNEARALRSLYPSKEPEEKFYRYLPRLEASLTLRADDGVVRRVNAMAAYPEHVSVEDVLRAHARGLDFRDVVWMYKRMLAALGFVHRKGFVHGAVLPPHVLVHPVDHGARLVDFCYAARPRAGETVPALVKAYRAWYAPEIPGKRAPSAATDIHMATKCAVALLGGDPATDTFPERVPKALARFLSTCLAPAQTRRPDDAWEVHEELDALLRRLIGEPTYRPLAMPARG